VNVAQPPAIALVVEFGFGIVYGFGRGFRLISRTREASHHDESGFSGRRQSDRGK
jgi:hypothetical protein